MFFLILSVIVVRLQLERVDTKYTEIDTQVTFCECDIVSQFILSGKKTPDLFFTCNMIILIVK